MPQTDYRVLNRNGRSVTSGASVTDFRGEAGTFESVSRGPESGQTPKVIVDGREYYATVWGLTVEAEAPVKEPPVSPSN